MMDNQHKVSIEFIMTLTIFWDYREDVTLWPNTQFILCLLPSPLNEQWPF